MTPLPRAIVAEALGTALLLAAVVGSGEMGVRLAGGNIAVALLANAGATAGALYVLIACLGPVSGAHFNPVVSLVDWLRGELPGRRLAAYLPAQVAGAVAGVVLAHAMFGLALLQVGTRARTGPAQWLSESVATAGLVLVILLGRRQRPQAVPALVAAYIFAAYWFTASTSFANPAVTLARSFTTSFAGIAPADAIGFVLAQLLGAGLGWALSVAVAGRGLDRPTPAA